MVMRATTKLITLCNRFNCELVQRARRVVESRPMYKCPPRKKRLRVAKHKCKNLKIILNWH